MDAEVPVTQRHFVVCGDNPLAYRLVEELVTKYDAHATVILRSMRSNWAPRICALSGVEVVEADQVDAPAFARAGLDRAAALAVVDQEDAGNVDAALLAQEINPGLRIVIRMFNLGLGERMSQLLNDCTVLSSAAIAAPAFVAAALDDTTTAPMQIADRTLVATRRENAQPKDIVCGLAIMAGQDEAVKLPDPQDEERADLVLARSRHAPRTATRPPRRRPVRILSLIVGARMRLALFALFVLFVAGTVVLALVDDVPWAQAAYIALLTELGGANADPTASGVERIALVVLTFVSIAVIPLLTVAVVDAVVKARLRIEAGGLVEPVSDHMVVVGLGDVGTRVVRALTDAGMTVVAVERNRQARGVQIARDLHVPVIIGDASHSEVMQAASVSTCRALVVVSTDDVSNLETALLGRTAKPDLRVVLRLFDGEFADRVQRAFSINISRSVSYLAAPAFAAAMLDRQIIATIPVGRRVLLIAELPVGAGSAIERMTVADLRRPHETRLLAVRTGGGPVLWMPPPGRALTRSDHLVVAATRGGLSTLLSQAVPGQTDDKVPSGLLAPLQTHRERSSPAAQSTQTSSEGPAGTPPIGPADAESTRPA